MKTSTLLRQKLGRSEADLVLLDRVSLRLAPSDLATAVATARESVLRAFRSVTAGTQDASLQVDAAHTGREPGRLSLARLWPC